jgi:hypothetical protein
MIASAVEGARVEVGRDRHGFHSGVSTNTSWV